MAPTALLRLASSSSIRQAVGAVQSHPHSISQAPTRPRRSAFSLPPAVLWHTRRGFQTSGVDKARVNSQERDSIDTEATEYTKSGTDDGAAHTDEAFDPSTTDPAGEKEGSKKDGGNTLDVSPANPEVSKPRGKQEGGAQGSGKE